ncbi:tetratricopeptide repeat protein [Prevotella pallens]|uniref:tetratricopeptide repeat protein n=1 Tax=Prevotella pallens TaxID=60133 RepID=UPI0023F325B4|nr:tetratricopeptide repeat protein [Prevotella pallens]
MEIRRLRKLLGYNNKHRDDVLAVFWQRLCCILAFLCLSILSVSAQTTDPDPVLLDKAVAYFNSEKYHEALLIFQQLDKRYKLNDRFRAYIGLCYYNEWEYKSATKYLDEVTPRLTMLAPHERSVYYFANAESHFQLQEYKAAIPFYEQALTVCYDNEKGEIYYRLGLCYMFGSEWEKARDAYAHCEEFFRKYRSIPDVEARLTQAINMRKGCQAKINEKLAIDSIARAKAIEDSLRAITASVPLDSVITEKPTDTIPSKSIVTTPMVGEKKKTPVPPIDDKPEKQKKKQEDVAPINLEDLYKSKVKVEE